MPTHSWPRAARRLVYKPGPQPRSRTLDGDPPSSSRWTHLTCRSIVSTVRLARPCSWDRCSTSMRSLKPGSSQGIFSPSLHGWALAGGVRGRAGASPAGRTAPARDPELGDRVRWANRFPAPRRGAATLRSSGFSMIDRGGLRKRSARAPGGWQVVAMLRGVSRSRPIAHSARCCCGATISGAVAPSAPHDRSSALARPSQHHSPTRS